MDIIEVNSLCKNYNNKKILQNISFGVKQNEIFGIVGPNGAGKTTTVECILGLRKPTSGSINLLGTDSRSRSRALNQRIGVQLQESILPSLITVHEAMSMFASFYPNHLDINAIIKQLNLNDKKNARFSKLSGGLKQRLFIAIALINDPEVVFFDELTTGLDPHGRRAMWSELREIKKAGKTVILVTHYMEEAEALCDRVAIFDKGKIIALDTPDNLIRHNGGVHKIEFSMADVNEDTISEIKQKLNGANLEVREDAFVVRGAESNFIEKTLQRIISANHPLRELHITKPNLEDVYLRLTESKEFN